MINKQSKIYLAGHSGLVGSAIFRKLRKEGYNNIITRKKADLDLTNQSEVFDFFKLERPEYVFLCAAKVGGIVANSSYPAEFIYDNIMIAANIINTSHKFGVKKLLNLGSSCIYPKLASQPLKEEYLLTGELEKTNEAYAIAKISAIKLCKHYNDQYNTNFISAMPTNQYGEGDNFNMETAHLLPMIMRRFYLAKLLSNDDFEGIQKDLSRYELGWNILVKNDSKEELERVLNLVGAYRNKVVVWGDGSVYRELMHSDDLADACVYLMNNKDYKDIGEYVNIAKGDDIKLTDLFEMVKEIVGFAGDIEFDKTKPNGTPRKIMDQTKINSLGWKSKIGLKDGVASFYDWYINA